jgi:hypothetical protein
MPMAAIALDLSVAAQFPTARGYASQVSTARFGCALFRNIDPARAGPGFHRRDWKSPPRRLKPLAPPSAAYNAK